MVTFDQFVRPALRKLAGHAALVPSHDRRRARRAPAQGRRAPAPGAGAARTPRRPRGREEHGQPELRGAALDGARAGAAGLPGRGDRAGGRRARARPAARRRLPRCRRAGTRDSGRAEGRLADVAGALLVGGASERMGADKAQRLFAGSPAADARSRLLASLFEEVLLVGGEPPAGALGRRVPDVAGPRSALRGIVSALAAARAERVLVVATDLPLLTADLLLALVAWPAADVVLPRRDGRIEPLCALWSRAPRARRRAGAAREWDASRSTARGAPRRPRPRGGRSRRRRPGWPRALERQYGRGVVAPRGGRKRGLGAARALRGAEPGAPPLRITHPPGASKPQPARRDEGDAMRVRAVGIRDVVAASGRGLVAPAAQAGAATASRAGPIAGDSGSRCNR